MITTINEFKLYLESVQFNDNIKFENLHLDTHHDQHDYKLNAIIDNKIVGYIEYSIFRGQVFISMIKSLISGKNVGPTMMKWLADKYGYEKIERTQLTPDGMRLRKKMDDYYNFDYEEYKKSKNKHLSHNIIKKIRNKYPLVADFISDMVLLGYKDTWSKWLSKIDSGAFKEFERDVLDLNEVSDITEWIKDSATNDNETQEDVPEPIINDLKKLL